MKIFKIIKEFFCPKMYSGIEIAEMGKNVNYYIVNVWGFWGL